MKLYHGSPVKNLKEITKENSDEGNFEGQACYFTDNKKIAKAYSLDDGSIYEVEINSPLLDLSSQEAIINFLVPIFAELNIDSEKMEHLNLTYVHLINHHGRNGIWSFAEDVSDIFKFEKNYKNIDREQIKNKINSEIDKFIFFKIKDTSEPYSNIYIFKGNSVPVIQEF